MKGTYGNQDTGSSLTIENSCDNLAGCLENQQWQTKLGERSANGNGFAKGPATHFQAIIAPESGNARVGHCNRQPSASNNSYLPIKRMSFGLIYPGLLLSESL